MTLFPTYTRRNLEIIEANGTIVRDATGKTYLDFVSGIAVCNLGHCHPVVKGAIQEQLQKVWHVSNLFQNTLQEEVAELLVSKSVGAYAFFCNSGAEANEAAIKLARKYTGRTKIVTFRQSFHGRTFATMSATGQEKIQEGYGPMLETFVYAPFNDIDALRNVVDNDTAAVLVEAVQGEGGVMAADIDFLRAIETLCEKHNALFIVDEVQTGIGRTGKAFAYEHAAVSPDIITVAKALGNGIPVGAMIGKEKLATAFGPGSHGSTFGGNMIAMAAAKAVMQVVFQEEFLEGVANKGLYFSSLLQQKLENIPGVVEVRGQGLMIGIVCGKAVNNIIEQVQEKGLLVLQAGPNVLRLLPPLTVTIEELEKAAVILEHVLQAALCTK
ncbi:acetylornithine transaminase [Ectobacillus sp. JY-23]|uniref:acetylornithine transaminase n=1 Tax=Ectobacillus sp. JY-23 TaxID=2933872 RepID=UPI001FF5924D|nr:acetylornithine transaminase [Ectobacillus sp. JY-23]UOY93901.1 acetylornithine transaminase [Ectobacillus sp. JY-23]